jgi:PAS domain S-box-containing protein
VAGDPFDLLYRNAPLFSFCKVKLMTQPASSSQILSAGEQIEELSKMVGHIRSALLPMRASLPPNTVESLSQIESRLYRFSTTVKNAVNERKDLLGLVEISYIINSSLEIDEVLRTVMDTIVRLTGAERGFLMLRDENGEMSVRIARNWEKESINQNETAISRTVIQRVIDSGEPLMTTNAQEDKRFQGTESIVAYNLRSILCVPLRVKNDTIGVIYTDHRIRTGIFNDSEKDLLGAFANQAAVALDNASLFASLRRALNLMENIFTSIVSGVITTNDVNQIMLVNRAAEAIVGRSKAEMIGRTMDEILPTLATDFISHLAAVRETDKPLADLEYTVPLPQRGTVDWRFNVSPLKDADQTTRGVAIVLDDMTERKKLEGQRKLFERMVSPAVIQQLNPNSLALGGKRTEISCLFADIRGFTSYSETLSPEQLVRVLNRYLAAGAEAVLEEEGTVDKFLGDAVMAWFNAPIPQPDHTLRAVRTAIKLRERIEALHKEMPPEEHLSFGVGIHFGDAVLGLIGTEKRLEYTAIGDSVNTTKRLQENAGRGQIVISDAAYERVKDYISVRQMEPMQMKGKKEPIQVYEVLELKK